jgi:hypothetical protein
MDTVKFFRFFILPKGCNVDETKFLIIYNEREESCCETDMARDSGASGKVKNVMQELARWFGGVCNIVWYHIKLWLILAIAS